VIKSKILYLSYRDINPPHSGRPTHDIIKALAQDGLELLVFEGVPSSNVVTEMKNVKIVKGRNISGNDVSRINGQLTKNNQENILNIIDKYLNQGWNPNLLFVDNFSELVLALKIARKLRIPILFRWYGVFDLPERINVLSFKFSPLTSMKALLQIRILQQIIDHEYGSKIVITEDGAKINSLLQHLKLPNRDKVIKMRNCIPSKRFFNFIYNKHSYINIIYISRIVEQKRPFTNIYMLWFIKKKYPNLYQRLRLYVIGDGPILQTMRNLAYRYEVHEKIIFTGYLKREEIEKKVPYASLSICINSHNPVVESLYSGVPVIINDFGEVKSVFHDIKGITFVDTKSLYFNEQKVGMEYAKAVVKVINTLDNLTSDAILRFSHRIRESVVKHFPSKEEKIKLETNYIYELISSS